MNVKVERKKSGSKLNIQKTKIMASCPITSWQIDEEKLETVTVFSWAPKSLQMVTAAEIKRHLLLGGKIMINLDNRDITFSTKVCIVKPMVFPVVMYRCESWIIKKGWLWKNWCFWTVVLEKTLESPLDSKEIKLVRSKYTNSSYNSTEYLVEGLILKLKLQYFGHLMWMSNSV